MCLLSASHVEAVSVCAVVAIFRFRLNVRWKEEVGIRVGLSGGLQLFQESKT
jgi:hypothetical protein